MKDKFCSNPQDDFEVWFMVATIVFGDMGLLEEAYHEAIEAYKLGYHDGLLDHEDAISQDSKKGEE